MSHAHSTSQRWANVLQTSITQGLTYQNRKMVYTNGRKTVVVLFTRPQLDLYRTAASSQHPNPLFQTCFRPSDIYTFTTVIQSAPLPRSHSRAAVQTSHSPSLLSRKILRKTNNVHIIYSHFVTNERKTTRYVLLQPYVGGTSFPGGR